MPIRKGCAKKSRGDKLFLNCEEIDMVTYKSLGVDILVCEEIDILKYKSLGVDNLV